MSNYSIQGRFAIRGHFYTSSISLIYDSKNSQLLRTFCTGTYVRLQHVILVSWNKNVQESRIDSWCCFCRHRRNRRFPRWRRLLTIISRTVAMLTNTTCVLHPRNAALIACPRPKWPKLPVIRLNRSSKSPTKSACIAQPSVK